MHCGKSSPSPPESIPGTHCAVFPQFLRRTVSFPVIYIILYPAAITPRKIFLLPSVCTDGRKPDRGKCAEKDTHARKNTAGHAGTRRGDMRGNRAPQTDTETAEQGKSRRETGNAGRRKARTERAEYGNVQKMTGTGTGGRARQIIPPPGPERGIPERRKGDAYASPSAVFTCVRVPEDAGMPAYIFPAGILLHRVRLLRQSTECRFLRI